MSPSGADPIFLLGPTGCGKSAVAVELADMLPGGAEIISADAYQVYRGLECLTAAPTAEEQRRVPHHLISFLEPSEANDAATHARRAGECLAALAAQGKRAIITGGSGLYVKFISHGISPAPPSDPQLRARLETLPLAELVQQLREADPEGAAATDLQNPRYVVRNLEIVLCGGKPLSHWRGNWQPRAAGPGFVLLRDTAALDIRIARRARLMLDGGAIREVSTLLESGCPLSSTAEKTLGLALIREHLEDKLGREELEQTLALHTRQYAKRQRTWLRRETWAEPLSLAEGTTAEHIARQILARLEARKP